MSDLLATVIRRLLQSGDGVPAAGHRQRGSVHHHEDETDNVNVSVWPSLVESQRREVMSASLLGVYGQWQSYYNVMHLVAKRLLDLTHLLGELDARSRDFQ